MENIVENFTTYIDTLNDVERNQILSTITNKYNLIIAGGDIRAIRRETMEQVLNNDEYSNYIYCEECKICGPSKYCKNTNLYKCKTRRCEYCFEGPQCDTCHWFFCTNCFEGTPCELCGNFSDYCKQCVMKQDGNEIVCKNCISRIEESKKIAEENCRKDIYGNFELNIINIV